MASKPNWKSSEKDKNHKSNGKTLKNEFLDEISLRDEIFDLKRQILILKKSNERNLIKLRKYEDETKKKDRQIEQLMDPVKNGDIRKLLSTKGAALLLNLKEQNNTLIQMVLAKDIQIRKLLSEIKTSKLYANGKRAESYRCEIDRLRNLLVKSRNILKENHDIQEKRSVCVGGTPDKETPVFSSDQSSPRDLEELHFTIQTLEIHMKYSNELLAKKNEQILQLTDQLNSLKSCNCGQNNQNKYFLEKYTRPIDKNLQMASGENETGRECFGVSRDIESSIIKCSSATSGFRRDRGRLPASAPPCPARNFQNVIRTPDRPSFDYRQYPKNTDPYVVGTCPGETRQFPGSEYNDAKDETNSIVAGVVLNEKVKNDETEEESNADTEEFEMMEKKIENDQIEIESPVKLAPDPSPSSNNSCTDESRAEEEILVSFLENESDRQGADIVKNEKVQKCEKNATRDEFDLNDLPEYSNVSDSGEKENSESITELHHYSFDSSLDSITSAWNPVKVEAEINHDCEIEKCVGSYESGDGNKNTNNNNSNNNNNNNNNNEDDDDDVIIG